MVAGCRCLKENVDALRIESVRYGRVTELSMICGSTAMASGHGFLDRTSLRNPEFAECKARQLPVGGRLDSLTWVDTNGNLWLFGGFGSAQSGTQPDLNDLWMYTP